MRPRRRPPRSIPGRPLPRGRRLRPSRPSASSAATARSRSRRAQSVVSSRATSGVQAWTGASSRPRAPRMLRSVSRTSPASSTSHRLLVEPPQQLIGRVPRALASRLPPRATLPGRARPARATGRRSRSRSRPDRETRTRAPGAVSLVSRSGTPRAGPAPRRVKASRRGCAPPRRSSGASARDAYDTADT